MTLMGRAGSRPNTSSPPPPGYSTTEDREEEGMSTSRWIAVTVLAATVVIGVALYWVSPGITSRGLLATVWAVWGVNLGVNATVLVLRRD